MKSRWFIEYYKVHYIEAGKDTYKFLIKHILIKIPFIIAMAFAGIFVGNKIFEPVNLTMNILTGLAGLVVLVIGVFFWNLLLYTRIRIFKKHRKTMESLEEQQKPKLRIDFKENDSNYFCDTSRSYKNAQTNEIKYVQLSHIWRISITNLSSSMTIENVEVKLIDINKCLSGDANKLPTVRLKFTSGNKEEQSFIDVNPNSCEFVDVIECFMKSVQIDENHFIVQHIEKAESYNQLSLHYYDIEKKDCKIKIEVSGKNTICEPKYFMVGLKDNLIKMWSID